MRKVTRIAAVLPLALALPILAQPAQAQIGLPEQIELPEVELNIDVSGVGADVSGIVPEIGSDPGLPVEAVPEIEPPDHRVIDLPDAVEAVRDNRALPMSDLMAIVSRTTSGQIIDVRLILVQNVLVYEVKLLGAGGVVVTMYFDAVTGAAVTVR
jgi:hypothetical protein